MGDILKEARRMWIVWLVLIVLLFFIGRSAAGEFERWIALRGELHEKQGAIELAEMRVENLERALDEADDPYQLEKEARVRFNLKKEGEEVFEVVGINELLARERSRPSTTDEEVDYPAFFVNIQGWYRYFFQ